jgi:hypothetical protein
MVLKGEDSFDKEDFKVDYSIYKSFNNPNTSKV